MGLVYQIFFQITIDYAFKNALSCKRPSIKIILALFFCNPVQLNEGAANLSPGRIRVKPYPTCRFVIKKKIMSRFISHGSLDNPAITYLY